MVDQQLGGERQNPGRPFDSGLHDDVRRAIEPPIRRFMAEYGCPGLSIAFGSTRGVTAQSYGLADTATREPLTTSHIFRIASLSKPITSVALFRLIESGKLKTRPFVMP